MPSIATDIARNNWTIASTYCGRATTKQSKWWR